MLKGVGYGRAGKSSRRAGNGALLAPFLAVFLDLSLTSRYSFARAISLASWERV
jgi:hypothetical protein